MGMMDAIMTLDQLVDESDPDVDFPNSFHAFQTAEGIRQAHPDKGDRGEAGLSAQIHRFGNKITPAPCADWFQLVGLIHDVGKIMAIWNEPQVGRDKLGMSGSHRARQHVTSVCWTLHSYFH